MNRRQFGTLAAAIAANAAATPASVRATSQAAGSPLAIEHVTVFPMTGEAPLPDVTVLIEGDRISAIGDAATVDVPEAATRFEGGGVWVIPALVDMHVHFMAEPVPELPYGPEHVILPFVATGVLQVAELGSSEHTNALRDEIAAGNARGPRMATARMVDGDPPIRGPEVATVVRTPDEARLAVAAIVAAGYDLIKVYSRLQLDPYRALLDEARARQIRVIGHIPAREEASLEEALLPGLAMVAHAEEFAFRSLERSDAEIAAYVELAQELGLALTTTLFLDEQILAQTRDPDILAGVEGLVQVNPAELPTWFEANHYVAQASPERMARLEGVIEFNQRLVRAFVAGGIPVLAGTDAIVPGVVAGYALHEELRALARAGLSNEQILRAATSEPARWLGVADDRGTVEVGQRANLLLLAADPLEDIANTKEISAVVHAGRLIERDTLDTMMTNLAALYAPVREWFSPRAAEILGSG